MRQSGTRPASDRCNRPGNSLRRARSPVAPNSTITCGCTGAINDGMMSLGSVWVVTCSDTHRTLWRHAGRPDTHAEMVAINW